jgi:hypothetical protein
VGVGAELSLDALLLFIKLADPMIHDISYPQVTGPGDTLAAKIYDFCGIQLSDETVNNIREWEA